MFESNAGDLSPAHFEEHALPLLLDIAARVKVREAVRPRRPRVPTAVTCAGWGGLVQREGVDAPMCVFARNAHFAYEALAAPSSG